MQVKLVLLTLYLNGGLRAVSIRMADCVPFLFEWRIACRFYQNGGLRAVSIRMADCVPFLSEWRITCRFYQNGGLRAVSIRKRSEQMSHFWTRFSF